MRPRDYRVAMNGPVPLPSRTNVAALAERAVSAVTRAAMRAADVVGPVQLDADRVATAYTSERWLRVGGRPPVAFAPLSAFFRVADGWVRTHANYPHHRAALASALRLSEDADVDAVAHELARWTSASAVRAISVAGGLCVAVRVPDPTVDDALRRHPLVAVTQLGAARPRPLPDAARAAPLRGIRVLDLTRVIAGPIATRTLALLGADVLRIDPPFLPELSAQHLDTGHGKRSALLDVGSDEGAAQLTRLLADADVVALGYRPAALARLGLSPTALALAHPGVIVLQLSAWGDPQRRGFDSLVQAESGIALLESATTAPGALPAQALDHSAGYLLAAAAIDLLVRRATEGGSWLAETSLRRVAAELIGLPRHTTPTADIRDSDPQAHLQEFLVQRQLLRTAAPAVQYSGGPAAFRAPRPWGGDEPVWR